jgi:hypothetical protein
VGVRLRRTLTVAALAALAMGGLSACETKVGMAASANSQRISNSELASYVKPGAKPYTPQNSTTQVVPKLYALENWIDNILFNDTISANGGPATSAERSAAQAVVLGERSVADFESYYENLGYTKKFGELIVEQSTTIIILVQRLGKLTPQQAIATLQQGGSGPAIIQAVNQTHPVVEVSPRYGEWNAATLSLSADPAAGLPSFVQVSGASPGAEEPAPAG